jgi:hypothetical protein
LGFPILSSVTFFVDDVVLGLIACNVDFFYVIVCSVLIVFILSERVLIGIIIGTAVVVFILSDVAIIIRRITGTFRKSRACRVRPGLECCNGGDTLANATLRLPNAESPEIRQILERLLLLMLLLILLLMHQSSVAEDPCLERGCIASRVAIEGSSV